MACVQQVATSASGAEVIQSCCKMIRKALLLKSPFLTSLVVWEDVFRCVLLGSLQSVQSAEQVVFWKCGASGRVPPSHSGVFCTFICLSPWDTWQLEGEGP